MPARARSLADQIGDLPRKMFNCIDADPRPSPSEVRTAVWPTKLRFDALLVIVFIELTWTPGHATSFMEKIEKIANGAEQFVVAFETFHDAPGEDMQVVLRDGSSKKLPCKATLALDRGELITFLVVARLTASTIMPDYRRNASTSRDDRHVGCVVGWGNA